MDDDIGSEVYGFEFSLEYSAILGGDPDNLIDEFLFYLFFHLAHSPIILIYYLSFQFIYNNRIIMPSLFVSFVPDHTEEFLHVGALSMDYFMESQEFEDYSSDHRNFIVFFLL